MKASRLISALIALFTGVMAAAASGSAHAIAWYFQTPASKMAADIDWLHQVVMWIILVIFVGVFGFMFYACYAHRRRWATRPSSSTRTPRSSSSGP